MTGVSLTFFISSVGILGMISVKFFELKTGRPSLMSKVSGKTNNAVRKMYVKTRRFLSYFNKRNAVLLLRFVLFHAFMFARKIYLKIKNKIMSFESAQKLQNMVQGKGVIKKKGAVSFFLQRINEEAAAEEKREDADK